MAQQKYTIIEKIDAGGMAEVWKGKASSLRGFEKMVAIKRVLPNLAKNKKFISMFLDEARLSLHLNHANVVQTFDIGVSDSSYFIVMEWVDGVNLKAVLEAGRERGWRLPKEQAVFVAIEICKGLSHAHARKDPDGRPLHIVHRDISPPNVLLSREGEVKLVDFGLAKAASQLTQTDPGIVKGKFSYLSPEATEGKPVDYRADVFATAIVLWESLAGRRLFDGETDLKTVEAVRAARIPPLREFNEEVEPQLEQVIMRGLAKDPRDRYQSAEEFGHELAKYLFTNRLLVTSYDLAVLVKRVVSQKDAGRPPRRDSMSGVTTVQAEIGHFHSLEDLDKLEFVSVAQSEDSPVSLADGIDPRAWALEMGVVDGEDTHMDVPVGEAPTEPGEPDPVAAQPPRPSRKVSIRPPDDDALPPLPSPTPQPRQRRIVEPIGHGPPPPPPGATAPGPGLPPSMRRAPPRRASRKPQPRPPPAHSGAIGVVLGVLGAVVIGGTIWFFLGS